MPAESDPGKLVGAKAIAAHFGKGPRWVYKKLEYSRRLRLARATERVHAVFLEATRRRFHALADGMPPEYADLRWRYRVPRCGPAQSRQACLCSTSALVASSKSP